MDEAGEQAESYVPSEVGGRTLAYIGLDGKFIVADAEVFGEIPDKREDG